MWSLDLSAGRMPSMAQSVWVTVRVCGKASLPSSTLTRLALAPRGFQAMASSSALGIAMAVEARFKDRLHGADTEVTQERCVMHPVEACP